MVVAAIYNNLWSWYSNETVVRAGGVRHVQGKRIRGFSMGYLSLAIPRGRNFWTTNVTTPDEWFRLRCRANQKLVVCCWLRSVNDHQGSQAPTTENCLFYNDFPRIFTNRPEPSRVQQLRTLWLYNLRCSTLTLQNRHNDFKRPFQFTRFPRWGLQQPWVILSMKVDGHKEQSAKKRRRNGKGNLLN